MRKVAFILIATVLLLTTPVQAVTCFRCMCNYTDDGHFTDSSNWSFTSCGSGAWCGTVQQTDPCGAYTWMAHISYPGTTIKRSFTFPATAGPIFQISFEVLAPTIPGTYYDELRVYVKDVSTGTLEFVGSARGTQLTSGCQRFTFETSKSYAGKTVELRFVTGSLSAIIWYLDNVAFWAGDHC